MKQTGNNWWHSHRHRHLTDHLLQEFLNVEVLIVQRIDQILRGEIAIDGQPLEELEAQIIRVRHHRIGHHRVDCVAYRTGAGNGRCAAAGHHLRCSTGAIVVASSRSTLALHLLHHLLLLLLVCCCRCAGLLHKLLLLHCQLLLLLLRVAHVHAGHLHLCGHHATTTTAAAIAAASCNALLLLQQLLHLHIATGAGSHVLLLLLSHQLLLHLCRR